jgi:acyl transferase domain-containing protein/acyl carrier protein
MKENIVVSHKLHPLLDSNVSTLTEQKFIKRLHREEIFCKEHVIHGLMILPGVVHLEIARAAAELSLGRPIQAMKNVFWGRPVVLAEESKDIVIALHLEGKDVSFEIRSNGDRDGMFSRGKIDADTADRPGRTHPATHDLDAIRKRNGIQKSKAEIFASLENLGFKYGPSFQLVDKLCSGETEALATLTPLRDDQNSSESQLCLALMDSAICTSSLIGVGQSSHNNRPRIPFSLGKLEVFSSLEKARYAYARVVEKIEGDPVSHVSILDEGGAELLLFENLLTKTFQAGKPYGTDNLSKPRPMAVGDNFNEEISKILLRGAAANPPRARISRTHSKSHTQAAQDDLFDKVASYLKEKISAAAKVPAVSIATQEPLNSQGISTAMIRELSRSLEADFNSLPGTLFFQFGTVEDLAKYFIGTHAERLSAILDDGRYSQVSTRIKSVESVEVRSDRPPVSRAVSIEPSAAVKEKDLVRDYKCDVAIIGLSGRYPKASDVERFWENLKLGVDAIEEIPAARWDYRKYYSPSEKQPGMTNSKWGGFIEDVDKFDAAFFSISPREADYMDPQQRLFLEVAWAACEDAGYSWERNRNLDYLPKENNVGVFVGLMYDDYHFFERKVSTSYWNSFVSNRVSHYFNFRGPSMTVDTACSSSLTSIYLAYESLRNGHCYAALAGGTNLSIHPTKYSRLSQLNMLSSEGRCKSFGLGGSGYVPGEGVGAVMLKRLEDAVHDGDHIYAIIKGGALNHGGKTNGFTVPNPNAQAELIAAAMENSGISPRTISYIEAHGTGTKLGDPIEITGLTTAFRKYTADCQFCAIGSVKSNIGHLEAASGIAALTKVVLQMQHRQQAPSLHAKVTNPLIDFQNSPFTLVQELVEWKRLVINGPEGPKEYPRRAGISSFGGGGANAHVILEEFVTDHQDQGDEIKAGKDGSLVLVPLSARTQERLKAYVLLLQECCRGRQDILNLQRVAYTLQTGRLPMEWRVAFLARDIRELCGRMEAFLAGKETSGCHYGQVGRGNELANIFGPDEDLQEAISKLMAKGKMEKLAQLWVKGLKIDWTKIYGDHSPLLMSLPTYPFAGDRYWVPSEKEPGEDDIVPAKAVQRSEMGLETISMLAASPDVGLNLLTFREEWKPDPTVSWSPEMSQIRVVYFATEANPAERFAAAMQAQGLDAEIVRVEHGESFTRLDRRGYQICSTDKTGYKQLFDSLKRDGFEDYVIVYRWAEGQGLFGIRGIYELISSMQGRRIRRLVLTGVLNNDLAACYDYSWIGYERSLKLIMPELSLNLLYSEGAPLMDEIVFQEMSSSGVIRYSGGERFRLSIAEVPLGTETKTLLKKNGVYLITGGCGGLGEVFAEYLANEYRAQLVLLGRRVEDDSIRQKLSNLANKGAAAAVYYSADVSDIAAMRKTIAAIRARFGRLDGIVHAAGIGPSLTIFDKDWNDFQRVLQPKLAGSIALDEATTQLDLDFICYFSSSSAVLGDFGSCDYSIANRFQMAFGSYCRRKAEKGHQRGKSIVINWPLWQEGGMTVGDTQQTEMYLKSSGQRYLERNEGLLIWEQIMGTDTQEALVLGGDPNRIKKSLCRLYGLTDLAADSTMHAVPAPVKSIEQAQDTGASGNLQTAAAQEVVATEEQIVRNIRATVSKILSLSEERLDDDVTWGDFGFDSITLGELSKVLSSHFQIEIAPSLFFSYSTIGKFCAYLLKEKRISLEASHTEIQQKEPTPPSSAETTTRTPQPAKLQPKQVAPPLRADVSSPPRPPSKVQSKQELPMQTYRGAETPIAIIGVAGRFPGANGAEELWRTLMSGKTTIREIPADRWDWRQYYFGAADKRNRITTNYGGFIEDVTAFDPLFFEISPREAKLMEPRQRVLLQEAWHAIEDSGYSGNKLRGTNCGVFIGVEEGDHAYLAGHQGLTPGNHNAMLAARISYYLDLQGPNLAVNTACSSGLVALHLACQALRLGECQMALAGGINLLLSPAAYLMLSSMGMLSPDGQCYPFDQRASGMVPAEGIGVVVLKPLSSALEDGDQIYSVIKGSGTNYDGRTSGITSPNALSQAALLEEIFARYQLDPSKLQLVIAHSVGSSLGDPIEVQALSQAIRKYSDARQFCALSSIKPLLGHSFAASGILNLIAMCMAMKHQTIPATRCGQPSNQLNLENSPFYLNRTNTAWSANFTGTPRMGLVGGTGMSGTNAFVVLEEPPLQVGHNESPAKQPERDVPVVLSAKSTRALEELASNLRKFLSEHKTIDLDDVAYTLQTGREAMTYRAVFLVRDTAELVSRLEGFAWSASGCGNCLKGEVKKRNRTTLASKEETLQNAISAWRTQGNGETLAQLWIRGAEFGWDLLYDDVRPRCISLPNYPFARRQFGILPDDSGQPVPDDADLHDDFPPLVTKTHDDTNCMKTVKRICVVGAGPSGLVMAKSLKEEGHQPVIFEKQDALGGIWVLRQDKSGGAYKKTRFQTSKYTSVFSDFFADDITSTFYSVEEVNSYLARFARRFQLETLIQYNSEVVSVQPSGGRWKVVVRHAGIEHEEEFDGVAMCHGMFWTHQLPAISGLKSFPGESFHSGQYYDNSIFKGKRVLVIGNGVSGMDIAEEASEVAQSVSWSMRSLKLILPRMVGFVPNDCQSVASLLLPSNRPRQLERLRRSMPEYFRLYEDSGLLPSSQDLERNPTIQINDNVVRLVAEGKVNVYPEVESFEGKTCRFANHASAEVDIVVFCTGYKTSACEYVPGIQPNDFSMGIFYRRNPTLVDALGMLPVAFFGSFSFSEMVARWYSKLLSGKYQLSESELQHRITNAQRAVIGPVASVLFGLKLGLFPSPEREFKEFWRLLNYPAFPMIYRLRGEHNSERAQMLLEDCRKKAFVKNDEHDPDLRELKYRILAGLGDQTLQQLLASGEVTPEDYSGAQLQSENALSLDWNMQYVQQEVAQADRSGSIDLLNEAERWPLEFQNIVERVRRGELDGDQLIATLSAETEYV